MEAVEELEKSDFMRQVLGEGFVEVYAKAKRAEWNVYREQVTSWEIDNYLHKI